MTLCYHMEYHLDEPTCSACVQKYGYHNFNTEAVSGPLPPCWKCGNEVDTWWEEDYL